MGVLQAASLLSGIGLFNFEKETSLRAHLLAPNNIERLALGPFCGSYIVRFLPCNVRNPVDLDRLGEFTEIEGPKRSSAWCRGLNWA